MTLVTKPLLSGLDRAKAARLRGCDKAMTEENRRELVARTFVEVIPHSRALGLTLSSLGDGTATMSVPYREDLVGDPATGVLAGGVVTSLLDTCCGAAVMAHSSRPAATATIDLRIDYMRPAPRGAALTADATCYRVTQKVAFVRAIAYAADAERPVATATGAFTVERGAGGPAG